MTTPDYITPVPIPTSPDDIAQNAFDYLAANRPGWVANDGVEGWLIYAWSFMAATVGDLAQTTMASIFRYFGESLLARHLPYLAPISAQPATVTSTWTAQDAAGYTIPAGTLVAFQVDSNTLVGFTVDADATIPAASTSVTGVSLTAVEAGAAGNGLSVPLVLVDDLSYITAVAAVGVPTAGVDAEADDAYLTRLAEQLELLAPRPVLAADAAKFALNVPGVGRAFGIDNYNPADSTSDNERMVTVAVTGPTGQTTGSTIHTEVAALFESVREANFVCHVIDATYTDVAVAFSARSLPGYDPSAVTAAAITAVQSYLSAVSWDWSSHVVLLDVVGVLATVPGLVFAPGDTVTLNGSAADLTLTGIAPLPGTVTVTPTVTAL